MKARRARVAARAGEAGDAVFAEIADCAAVAGAGSFGRAVAGAGARGRRFTIRLVTFCVDKNASKRLPLAVGEELIEHLGLCEPVHAI